jgi:uncharacterized protein (TIGR00725 family)
MQAVMDVSSRIGLLRHKVALFRSFSKSGKRCTGLRPGLEPGPVLSFIDGQANQEGYVMRLCVFCGSNAGQDPVYFETAQRLGKALATNGIDLVYGGAAVGLMGAVADATLAGGGHVIGVMPQALVDKEIAHRGLSELRVVGSMHERKALMAELADGFIALPGGLGTFEELREAHPPRHADRRERACCPDRGHAGLRAAAGRQVDQGGRALIGSQAL